ncbi:hypothetical protein HKX48_002150, partial [Thoreauomyces humboldtii]
QDSTLRHTAAGAAAGLLSSVLVCPLDVLKIRIQNQVYRKGVVQKYRGTVSGLQIIWREEGIRGLYRGLGTTTIAYIFDRAIWFGTYSRLKETMANAAGRSPEDAGTLIHLNSSVAASLLTMAVVNPLWVIRTRMMVQTKAAGESTRWHYRSTYDAFRTIIKEEGIGALYKGLTPSLLGITHVAVQFPLYEHLKIMMRGLEHRKGRYAEDLSAASILLASAGSKMIASIVTYPHEVLRTRLQTQSARRPETFLPVKHCEGPDCPPETKTPGLSSSSASEPAGPKYRGLVHAVKVIWTEESWRAFYRGLGTNLIRTVPASALSLWMYEVLVQKLNHAD